MVRTDGIGQRQPALPADTGERARTPFSALVTTGLFWSAVRVTLDDHRRGLCDRRRRRPFHRLSRDPLALRDRGGRAVDRRALHHSDHLVLPDVHPVFRRRHGIEGRLWRGLRLFPDRAQYDRRLFERSRNATCAPRARWAPHTWHTFRHVLLPGAFPVLVNGMRISFFIAFASVLGGEVLSSIAGVGRNIALAAELMEPARMYRLDHLRRADGDQPQHADVEPRETRAAAMRRR